MKEAFSFLLMFMVVIGALQFLKAENASQEKTSKDTFKERVILPVQETYPKLILSN